MTTKEIIDQFNTLPIMKSDYKTYMIIGEATVTTISGATITGKTSANFDLDTINVDRLINERGCKRYGVWFEDVKSICLI